MATSQKIQAQVKVATALDTEQSKMQSMPWGTITGVVNVVGGVLFALSAGVATMTSQLPDGVNEKYGVILTAVGLTTAAVASGLMAVGRGLHNIGEGSKVAAAASIISKPTQEQTINVNAEPAAPVAADAAPGA
jgi:hypothetical protein